MTPIGQEPIEVRIAEAVEPELFVDEADLGEIVVRTIHRVKHLDVSRCSSGDRNGSPSDAADAYVPMALVATDHHPFWPALSSGSRGSALTAGPRGAQAAAGAVAASAMIRATWRSRSIASNTTKATASSPAAPANA